MNKLEAKSVNVYYGDNHVLKNVGMTIHPYSVTALIGP